MSDMLHACRDFCCLSEEVFKVGQGPCHRQFSVLFHIELFEMDFNLNHAGSLLHFGLLNLILDNFLNLFLF